MQGTGGREALKVDLLRDRLQPLGYEVEVVEQTGSTNTDLAERTGCPSGTVRIAEEQVSGRGRMGRAWTAPARSQLIVSVSHTCPDVPVERVGLIPLVAGLSIAQGIIDATSVPARLKWPNDVLVERRKLVGVLIEAPELQPVPRVVIGFGVNYDLTREELPVPHATSLALETEGHGAELASREEVLVAILTRLNEDLQRFRSMGGAPLTFMSRYKQLSATLGTPVKVMLPGDRELLGTAVGIADGGELVVADEQGTRHSVAAGDVIHVRPRSGTAYSESSE